MAGVSTRMILHTTAPPDARPFQSAYRSPALGESMNQVELASRGGDPLALPRRIGATTGLIASPTTPSILRCQVDRFRGKPYPISAR